MKKVILLFLFCLICVQYAYSSGVVARQRTIKNQRHQIIQQKEEQKQSRNTNISGTPKNFSDAGSSPLLRSYNANTDIINIEELWVALETSSEDWLKIIDNEPKKATVDMYINWYEKKGIHIRKPPDFYVDTINNMLRENSQIASNPFKYILKIAAIIEYDFDNGANKDLLAKEVLGQKAYEENKKRLGL